MTTRPDLTRNEQLVLEALRGGEGPLSAYQLLEGLRAEGLRAPPQIYRALKSLGERGLIHKLDSRNAFLACSHGHSHEHDTHAVVFLVCDDCDSVEEVGDASVDGAIGAVSGLHGFAASGASVEIRGRCRICLG